MKTAGQIAYETELLQVPVYLDGTPRKSWDELPDYSKKTWEDNPTPRTKNEILIEVFK